jgi:GTPase SAR1 family protein
VDGWYKKVRSTRGNEALIVLMGNKVDMAEQRYPYPIVLKREVSAAEALEFAEEREILHFEVSARDATNIEHAFLKICHNLPIDNSFLVT